MVEPHCTVLAGLPPLPPRAASLPVASAWALRAKVNRPEHCLCVLGTEKVHALKSNEILTEIHRLIDEQMQALQEKLSPEEVMRFVERRRRIQELLDQLDLNRDLGDDCFLPSKALTPCSTSDLA